MNLREQVLEYHEKSYEENSNCIYGFFKDYRYLSSYHLVDIEYEGIIYPSTENIYQLLKDKNNKNTFKTIFSKITPNESKFLGKYLPLRLDWDVVKNKVMYDINLIKYKTDPLLKQALLNTGNKELIELNWWNDRYWGAVLVDGVIIGENNLGKTLMKVREDLK